MKNVENQWDRISRSAWRGVYLNELYWLSRETSELCDAVFQAVVPPPSAHESFVQIDHEVHNKIYRALNNAARINSLIKDRPRKMGSQSAGQYEIQRQRVRWLTAILDGIVIQELRSSRVRHSLEHFDEFIDETALKSIRGGIPMPTFFPLDMVLGRESTMQDFTVNHMGATHTYPLRVYLAEEQVFINCGKRINLADVATECRAIAERVSILVTDGKGQPFHVDDDRGSLMVIIGSASDYE